MKFLGVAVAFLVLAVSLEYANAAPYCPDTYSYSNTADRCVREVGNPVTYQVAYDDCHNDLAIMMTDYMVPFTFDQSYTFWMESGDTSDGYCEIVYQTDVTTVFCNVTYSRCCVHNTTRRASLCGDPVADTFDDAVISVTQPGTYLLVEILTPTPDYCNLRVTATVAHSGNVLFPYQHYVLSCEVEYAGSTFVFDQTDTTVVGGDTYAHSYGAGVQPVYAAEDFTLFWEDDCLVLVNPPCGATIKFCPRGQQTCCHVLLEWQYENKVEGLFGNFDLNTTNDYRTQAGVYVGNLPNRNALISQSWLI